MNDSILDQPATILVVEDEPKLVRLVETLLTSTGHRVLIANDGQTAIEMAAIEAPDLVILDLLLPGAIDGFAVCERIRGFSSTPIIMLTARTREPDKLRGFSLGADDYITKPFSARELLARVRAVLRRSRGSTEPAGQIQIEDLIINQATYSVSVAGNEISLTPTEYRLLLTLARHPDQVITHTDLLSEVWGAEYRDELTYLRTYIRYLRSKIEPDPTQPRFIKTRSGIGYYLSSSNQD
ncbi:MAG: DNA-binding response regulator [Sphaerobacteraceae bacterium]|nr:MAG: DNA-binding response regulator [Sphaerobacteraceae bacterium]